MPVESAKPVETFQTPNRLWAEQLAIGSSLLIAILIFLACFHTKVLSDGMQVLGPNDLDAYGWMGIFGAVILQVVVHELGTLGLAWWMRVPLRFFLFGFGANATVILSPLPRKVWRDALVGFVGPVTGTVVSLGLHGAYEITKAQDVDHFGSPLLLGMACVGYFYNLFTLIPILIMEGGWIAPAIAPQAWLLMLIVSVFRLVDGFNIVLLCVFCFALPRFVLLIRARAPRTDLPLTNRQRVGLGLTYIVLVVGLAWVGSKTFEVLPTLVRASKGD